MYDKAQAKLPGVKEVEIMKFDHDWSIALPPILGTEFSVRASDVASHILRNQKLRGQERFWMELFEKHLLESNWDSEAKQSPGNAKRSGLVHEKVAVYEATYNQLLLGHEFISAVCKPGMSQRLGMLWVFTERARQAILLEYFLLEIVKPLFRRMWKA